MRRRELRAAPAAAFALLAALSASVFSAPVLAQGPPAGPSPPSSPSLAADRAQLLACLRQSQGAAQGCIGSIAIACVRDGRGDRSRAEQSCAKREEAVWRERLTLAGQVLGRSLDAGQRARFVTLQLAWEGYVAQKCLFYAGQQAPALQPGRQAGCELREVARRAIELEPAARPGPAPRRPQARPEIFR